MTTFLRRMARAALLDPSLYEEVEADRRSLTQALAVVLLASLAAGIGTGWPRLSGILVSVVLALLGWAAWSLVTWWVGTRFLPEPQTRSDFQELLRTIGFAASPGVLRVFGVVPGLRRAALLVSSLWMLAAMVVAVRQALDYRSITRALLVCAVGWLVQVLALASALVLIALLTRPAY
jgi:hypothetical protein